MWRVDYFVAIRRLFIYLFWVLVFIKLTSKYQQNNQTLSYKWKPLHSSRPLLILAVTAKMKLVKEAGADTPPTIRRPWRNYMSRTLKIVTKLSRGLNQRRPDRWVIVPEQKRRRRRVMMLAEAADEMVTTDPSVRAVTRTRQYVNKMKCRPNSDPKPNPIPNPNFNPESFHRVDDSGVAR